jgi:hypothetical protein
MGRETWRGIPRRYLTDIVARLTDDAKRAAEDTYHAAVLTWAATFSKTADGEETSEEVLAIVIEAQANGYQLAKDDDGAIRIIRNTVTSFVRSNPDIVRFGKLFLTTLAS